MMWQVTGRMTAFDWIDLTPVNVLYEFDGPRIFTCRDNAGELLLAYQCGGDGPLSRFVLVPFTPELERRLVDGEITVREALDQPRTWLIDLNADWEISSAWQVRMEDIPSSCLPRPGAMLLPSLQQIREDVVTETGYIREFDRGQLTFKLRNQDESNERQFLVDSEDIDVMESALDAFNDEYPVKVAGQRVPKSRKIKALTLVRIDGAST